MTRRVGWSLAALVLAAAPVAASETTAQSVERLRALAKKDSQVMALTKHLCETIGPRLTGSDGINAAYDWTQKQFASYGLKAWREAWGDAAIERALREMLGAGLLLPEAHGVPELVETPKTLAAR